MIKAVHYFSNTWAANFWSGFHPERVMSEFGQIKQDGFNTIILLIPWQGFQHDMAKCELNQEYMRRLRLLLEAASKLELKVLLRVSYVHYFCPYSLGTPRLRMEKILLEPEIKKHWMYFLAQIGNAASAYSSFEYAFISWEDFWHSLTGFQQRDSIQRHQLAKKLKYDRYINEHVGLGAYNAVALAREAVFETPADIDIPVSRSPRHKFYLDFINWQLNDILTQARDFIAPLIMEVRIDRDSYVDKEGRQHWYDSDLQIDSQLPRLTYWAPFMGALNEGEKLSASQALETLSHTMEKMSHWGTNKRHIINQFNFIDETPLFKGVHAEIAEDQMAGFMAGAAKILQSNSLGYGLWAYRDYCQNLLFNPGMSRCAVGWVTSGRGVKFPRVKGEGKLLLLGRGATIEQRFFFSERGIGMKWLTQSKRLYFMLETSPSSFNRSASTAGLELTFAGEKPASVAIEDGIIRGEFDISHITDAYRDYSLRITNTKGKARIRMVYLYFYDFKNDVYEVLGEPGKYRDLIVQFNKDLDGKVAAPLF